MGLRLGAEVRRALCLRVAAEREREREAGPGRRARGLLWGGL
jgi:hypothetical protein